jgi:tRNA(adenine34) deaminase
MQHALSLARKAAAQGEIPVGAVITYKKEIIAEGWNQSITLNDPTAHAEILALRAAAKHLNNYRLTDCNLYVTLEPCPMCAGAMVHARINRLIYGASDPIAGAAGSVFQLTHNSKLNHQLDCIGAILVDECSTQLKEFFQTRR